MRSFRTAALVGVPAFWLLFYFACIQAVQPWGQGWFFRSVSAGLVFIPLAVALAAVFALTSLFRRQFGDAMLGAAVVLFCVGAFYAFRDIEWFFRRRAIVRVVRELAVLPKAIRGYTAAEGHPPPTLDALVPQYIQAIPATGLGAYPDFEYRVGSAAPPNEEWALLIPTSMGILNWDLLLYLPSERYPAQGWGGSLERVGAWAYVHE